MDPNAGEQLTTCDYDKPAKDNQFCEFKIDELGDLCTKERRFGYEEGRPCIIVKLNKIYDWMPQFYGSVDELPAIMPDTVKEIISKDFADPVTKNVSSRAGVVGKRQGAGVCGPTRWARE